MIEVASSLMKRLWMTCIVRIERSAYQDDFKRLDHAYNIKDPWNMTSAREKRRFQAINEIIAANCRPISSILEIGSGEGHHTEYLQTFTHEIVGVEASPQAIARARQRCPTATFIQAYFPHLPVELGSQYDLVVASEVLYYIRDLERAILTMNRLGRYCLVSCYDREIDRHDRYLLAVPNVMHQTLQVGSMRYRIYLWAPQATVVPSHG